MAATRWRFAKTYVESYPHEYVLQQWGDADAFSKAIQLIEQWGLVESFWKAERRYLYVDERKYWHMGNATSENPAERPTLINRTWLDVSRYRENAKTLDITTPLWIRSRRDGRSYSKEPGEAPDGRAAVQMLGWAKTPHNSDLEGAREPRTWADLLCA